MIKVWNFQALIIVSALSILVASVYADVPKVISYQGRLTDSDGNPVADGDYGLTFQIVEHDPMPMGESPLWSSGVQTVTVTEGLFDYYLGSNVPLPAEIFNDGGLESYFLRIHVEGSMLYLPGTELASVPFAVRSIYSDTAAYAFAGPGGGSSGWIDDGTVVRLDNAGDLVGIGTATPNERLVVGKDMGSMYGDFVVAGNPAIDGTSGFTAGYDIDNRGWFSWDNEEKEFQIGVRSNGTNTPNSIYLANGNVGIGNTWPGAPLSVGNSMGSYPLGNFITVGDNRSGGVAGVVFGQNPENKGILAFSNEYKLAYWGTEENGTQHYSGLVLKSGNVGIGTIPDSTKTLHIDRTFNLTPAMIGYGVFSKVHNIGVGSALMAGSFQATGPLAYGIYVTAGESDGAIGTAGHFSSAKGTGIYSSGTEYAGDFSGDVDVVGTLSKSGGSFRIDHPLDPENRYLQHSFVESPEMMNIYNGNVELDENGEAAVKMPEWFEPLNRDFRYQLTAIGAPGPDLYIAEEIIENRFVIAGGQPGMKVSWQVTGVRQDPWANENRVQVEVDKPEDERGLYRHPEVYGLEEDKGIDFRLKRGILKSEDMK